LRPLQITRHPRLRSLRVASCARSSRDPLLVAHRRIGLPIELRAHRGRRRSRLLRLLDGCFPLSRSLAIILRRGKLTLLALLPLSLLAPRFLLLALLLLCSCAFPLHFCLRVASALRLTLVLLLLFGCEV